MTIYAAIDFETTGLPNGRDLTDPAYPRIVQAGAVMFDDAGKVLSSLHCYVRPDWPISSGAQKVHGITEMRAGKAGIREDLVLIAIVHMSACCEAVVTYSGFDRVIVEAGLIRLGREKDRQTWTRPGLRWIDMQTVATPIVNERFEDGGQKWPALKTAMETIIGSSHEDAHDALGDAVAAMRLFLTCSRRGLIADMSVDAAE